MVGVRYSHASQQGQDPSRIQHLDSRFCDFEEAGHCSNHHRDHVCFEAGGGGHHSPYLTFWEEGRAYRLRDISLSAFCHLARHNRQHHSAAEAADAMKEEEDNGEIEGLGCSTGAATSSAARPLRSRTHPSCLESACVVAYSSTRDPEQ